MMKLHLGLVPPFAMANGSYCTNSVVDEGVNFRQIVKKWVPESKSD